MNILREELIKLMARVTGEGKRWSRGIPTSRLRPFLFENEKLNQVSTSLSSIRKELRAMETEGLVTADRRMRNVTIWALPV